MKLRRNIIYQILYQIISLGLPLIIAPYLTRVLGAELLGTYSYSFSIAYFFVLFAMLGIQNHGCRSISACCDDTEKRRKTFWSIYFVHIIFSIVALTSYIVFAFLSGKDKMFFIILGLYVLSALFDVSWYFYGIEKVKFILIQNTIVKIFELVFILLFVKGTNDIYIYTLIMAGSILLGQIIMFPNILHNNRFYVPSIVEIKKHVKPIIVLSVSVFASSLYTMFDKTIIGLLTTKENVAFYEYSEKIVKIPLNAITSIGSIMLANITKYLSKEDNKIILDKMEKTFVFVSFLSFAFAFGIASIAKEFVQYYYDIEFIKCGTFIMCLCPVIVIISFGNILRTQYLLPLKKDYQYIFSIVICSIVNLTLDFILIPFIGVSGAIIGTLVAETTGLVVQSIFSRKDVPLWRMYKQAIPFFTIGIIMFSIIMVLNYLFDSSILFLCVKILIGMIVYVSLSFIYFIAFRRDMIFIRRKK